jgi:outer membrane protein TolC
MTKLLWARRFRLAIPALALLLAGESAGPTLAQEMPPGPAKLQVMVPLRWYEAPAVAPIRLNNSSRLYNLIRAGNLYLSAQDAVALAIENNLGLEVDRYGPLLAQSALERSRAGGPLRGVPSGNSQVSSVNSGVGVNGTIASAGLSSGGGSGGGGGGGNATIQQIGAVTPNLDPVLQSTINFSHLTQPQANQSVSQTTSLVQGIRQYNTTVQEGTLTGGTFSYRNYQQHFQENAPTDLLNPVSAPRMDLIFRQNLLQGFGVALNNRFIRVAQINLTTSRESFRASLLNLVTSVLNLYWDYVSANDELKLRQHAVALTEKFAEDTKYEISIGAIAGVELPRAEADLASRRQDLTIAQAALRQRAIVLKEALSHSEDPALEAAQIVAVDRIEVPAEEESLPALREMVAQAMAKRPDVQVSKLNDQTQEINLAGTTNPLLPSLGVTLQTFDRGVAGSPQASGGTPNAYFVGGYGTALGQIFRRNFANNYASVSFSAPFHNRQAQGDYGIDQLQFRQQQMQGQRNNNQIVVDVASQMAAVRQARARYQTAKNTRQLQEQLLDAERKRSYGPLTFNYIMTDQRALIAAELSEGNAAAAYMRARIALDQVLGETLEKNRITLDEGLSGRVERQSELPIVVGPAPAKQ